MFRWSWLPFSTPLILALRNMRVRWIRFLLTMMGIVVGVASMVAVSATNASTLDSINRFFDEAAGRTDLFIESGVFGQGFDASIVNTVQRFPEVEAAAPMARAVTVLATERWEARFTAGGSTEPGSEFWLIGVDPAVDTDVHDYELASGRLLLPDEEQYSVLLVDEFAAERGLEVGNDLPVATTAGGVVDLRIVGHIARKGIGITNEGAVGIVPLNVVQELFDLGGDLTGIDVAIDPVVAGNPDELARLRAEMQAQVGDEADVKYPASRGQTVAGSLQNYQLGLDFFSAVSLFVGSFLIYNAFAMTVVERTRELGMLRAVGTTRKQILALVLVEAVVVGVLGSTIGLGLGLVLARGLIIFMGQLTGQTITVVSAAPESLVQAFVIGVVVTLAAAAIPAIQAARVSPVQALRVQARTDEGRWLTLGLKFGPLTLLATLLVLYLVPFRPEVAFFVGSNSVFLLLLGATLCIPIFVGVLERLFRPLVYLIFSNEGRLGSNNLVRVLGRTTLTVAALMVGISMVIGINGLTGSFEKDILAWAETAIGGDLYVRSPLRMRPELESRLRSMEEIAALTRIHYVGTRIVPPRGEDEAAIFAAVDPQTYLSVSSLRIDEGPDPATVMRELAEGGSVILGTVAANRFDLGVGDTIRLETKRGQQDFRIVATNVDFTGGEALVMTGSWDDMRRYFGVNDVSRYTAVLAPGASLEEVTVEIEEVIGRGQNLAVESNAQFQEQMSEITGQAFALFDVLGLIGLVVAALGVINTMLMNVLERTRELGGLRSLGMTRTQVRRMILAEATAIGLMGALFGVLFGLVLSDVFLIGIQSLGGFVLERHIPYPEIAAGVFLSVMVALAASWYPAVRAANVNIVEAIKNE